MVNDASPMRDAVETGDGSRAWLFLRRVPEYEAAWRARRMHPAWAVCARR